MLCLYFNENGVNLLKKNIKDMRVSFVGDTIPMDPVTLRSLRSRIQMDLLPYCEGRSMIPVDPSANSTNCESRIYDPNGFGIQILGIKSWDPFSGSTDMSGRSYVLLLPHNGQDDHTGYIIRRNGLKTNISWPLPFLCNVSPICCRSSKICRCWQVHAPFYELLLPHPLLSPPLQAGS